MMAHIFLPGALALVSVLLLTRLVIIFATRGRWWESLSDRSSHARPTLSRGGVGFVIFLTLALPVYLVELLGLEYTTTLLGCGCAIALVGYLDDARPLPVLPRLVVHLLAAILSVWVLWPQISSLAWVILQLPLVMAGLMLVLFWVWFINFFNFMDGIDGIAGAEVAFIGVVGALLSYAGGHTELASAWALLAGAALGFLAWNAPPARIFMGDVGSGFLGFIVAALLLLSVTLGAISPWVALLLVAAFLGDATVTLLRRMLRGERWYEGHREHAYQHLAIRWGGHGKVTLAYTFFNLLVVAPAVSFATASPQLAPPITIGTFIAVVVLALAAGAGSVAAPPRGATPPL